MKFAYAGTYVTLVIENCIRLVSAVMYPKIPNIHKVLCGITSIDTTSASSILELKQGEGGLMLKLCTHKCPATKVLHNFKMATATQCQ